MDSETFQRVLFIGLVIWVVYFAFIKNPKE